MPIFGALMGFLLFSGAVAALPAHADAPVALRPPEYSLSLTGYNAVPAQTDGDPFVTASGAYSNPEVVAARSQDLAKEMPFGTIIQITGPSSDVANTCGYEVVAPEIGYRVIADTMNVRYTDRVDVLFSTKSNYVMGNGSTKNAGTILGICQEVGVRVVGYVDISNPANLPKTQEALAAIVTGKSNSLALNK